MAVCSLAQPNAFALSRGRGPVGLEDFHEMFSNAATAGASIHICHTLSSARAAHQSGVSDLLEMATKLNEQGIDISFEQYPYPYGMTNLRTEQSSVWNPNQLLRQVKRKDSQACPRCKLCDFPRSCR